MAKVKLTKGVLSRDKKAMHVLGGGYCKHLEFFPGKTKKDITFKEGAAHIKGKHINATNKNVWSTEEFKQIYKDVNFTLPEPGQIFKIEIEL